MKLLNDFLTAVILLMATGCAYNGTSTLNFSLINSRSPAITGVGTNSAQAANGYTGGGTLDAEVPVSAVP